jgi:hypothetical protein
MIMGNGILSIVVGAGIIVAAMSGLTLRGTHSSAALGALGGVVLLVGVVRIVRAKSRPPPQD